MSRTFNRPQLTAFALFIHQLDAKQNHEISYHMLIDPCIELVAKAKALQYAFEKECNGIRKTVDQEYTIPPSLKKLYRTIEVPDPVEEARNEARIKKLIADAKTIAATLGFAVYIQQDPRGCPIYLYHAADLKEGYRIDSLYPTLGIAVPID